MCFIVWAVGGFLEIPCNMGSGPTSFSMGSKDVSLGVKLFQHFC